jgi:hypothetical protein
MGLLSILRRAGAKVYGGVKRVTERISSATTDAVKAFKSAGAKMLAKLTGKEKYEEAMRRYKVLSERAEQAMAEHHEYLKQVFREMEQLIAEINARKRKLYEEQFVRFVVSAGRYAHWELPKELVIESVSELGNPEIHLRDWNDLKLIDFDNEKFKTYALSLLTLGFWTRKRAKETLLKVKEEEKALDYELAKLSAERVRHNLVLKALEQVSDYLQELTCLYERVLRDVEFSTVMLANSMELTGLGVHRPCLNAFYLPKHHLLCLMAADKLTRILHDMAGRRYLNQSGEELCQVLEDFAALDAAKSEANSIALSIHIAA